MRRWIAKQHKHQQTKHARHTANKQAKATRGTSTTSREPPRLRAPQARWHVASPAQRIPHACSICCRAVASNPPSRPRRRSPRRPHSNSDPDSYSAHRASPRSHGRESRGSWPGGHLHRHAERRREHPGHAVPGGGRRGRVSERGQLRPSHACPGSRRPGNVTLAPAPGATVTFTDLTRDRRSQLEPHHPGLLHPRRGGRRDGHPGWARVPVQHDLPQRPGLRLLLRRRRQRRRRHRRPASRSSTTRSTTSVSAWRSRAVPIRSARSRSPHNVCGPGLGYGDTDSTQPGHYIEIGGITGVTVDNNAFLGPADPNAAPVGLHLNVFHIFGDATNVDFSNNILWHTQTIGQATADPGRSLRQPHDQQQPGRRGSLLRSRRQQLRRAMRSGRPTPTGSRSRTTPWSTPTGGSC